MKPASTYRPDEYLTTEEAARRYKFTETAPKNPTREFRAWAERDGIQPARRGRVLLWDARFIDFFINRPR